MLPAAVVLLHGSGDSGRGLQRYLEAVDGGRFLQALASSAVTLRFPDSGVRSYTLAGGMPLAIWYDRTGLAPSSPEDTVSVEDSVARLMDVLKDLRAEGIPPERTVIGGFSMGGGIALQLALRHPEAVAGAFVLSSYMCDDAAIWGRLPNGNVDKIPQIFMAHGQADNFIRPAWGKATADRLQSLGIPVRFVPLTGVRHELNRDEIETLGKWLRGVLGASGDFDRTGAGQAEEL